MIGGRGPDSRHVTNYACDPSHDIFAQIPDFKGPTVGVGLSGILLLVLLQKMGDSWGKKSKIIWAIGGLRSSDFFKLHKIANRPAPLTALARSFIALLIYTGLSYGLNKNRKTPIFDISKVKANGIAPPKMPSGTLISKVFARSIAPFSKA